MNDLTSKQIKEIRQFMDKAIEHLENELTKVRAGKATPAMLDSIMVDYYGAITPIQQVANVSAPDAKTILIQPWEKQLIHIIERAILEANIGFNPQNDGIIIRLNVPPLTEERRRELVKKVKEEAEKSRIAIRNIRKDGNEKIKRLKSSGLSEDEIKVAESEIQKITDDFIFKVGKLAETKEKDLMTL